MGLVTIGVQKIEYAPLAGDGGPGTVFTSLGLTSKNTLTFNEEPPTKKLVEVEESADPIAVFKRAAARSLSYSIANPDLQALAKIRGGTVTTLTGVDTLEEDAPVSLVGTLKITPEEGMTAIIYNHVSMDGRLSGALGADQELLLVVDVDVLKPTKTSVKTVSYTAASAT